ncbi:hypothetical protein DSM106972_072740 [Dulcicalothrix desertica PCC 7102]|uniref:Uncharacterized protein n=1 Tax=Dulcicalothrix desertica PCC 7102 TaxID=232991 RepID=A0A3S1AXM8_9CYAN|nr:hypothetical protein [Dulcicalothrix desertica]RUT00865.1 hypothetical protein DSM106972_072740 [Dulcicalothrix desertica PCC 7102]TWH42298.1 hypothetical protein CAL7102_05937 [Dulcicalothrix desertica PCC 7102]
MQNARTPIHFNAVRQWSDRYVGTGAKAVPENTNGKFLGLVTLALLAYVKFFSKNSVAPVAPA